MLDDVARQAGVVVHGLRLTADLQRSRERLVTTREEERRRLRRDLHDGLGPALASINLKLDAARNLLVRDPAAADELLAEFKGQAQATIADIRRLVYELRPPALDELGLLPAIREYAMQFNGGGDTAGRGGDLNGLRVSIEAPDKLPPLPAAVEVAVYRIALEGLTNVARHAKASTCVVRLFLLDGNLDGNAVELEITDDGVGLPAGWSAGVGVTSMRERATELGGSYAIGPAPSGGTRVLATLPLDGSRRGLGIPDSVVEGPSKN